MNGGNHDNAAFVVFLQGDTPSTRRKKQKEDSKKTKALAKELKSILRKFLDEEVWNAAYKSAYKKMTSSFAEFSATTGKQGLTIYGNECSSSINEMLAICINAADDDIQFRTQCHCPTAIDLRTGIAHRAHMKRVVLPESTDNRG